MCHHRKSSTHITLVVIATVTLMACSDKTIKRDVYTSREDCLRDWRDYSTNDPAELCEPIKSANSIYYYGPRYCGMRRGPAGTINLPRSNSRAVGVAHISRGGFGSSALHFGGGG